MFEPSKRESEAVMMREHVVKMQKAIIKQGMWQCCLCCEFWQNKEELCGKVNARPPAIVIATGCPAFLDDIPF